MTKKLIIILLSIIFFIYPIVNAQPVTESSSTILMEAKTGKVLLDKNANIKHYPASITKILTAIITIENTNLTDIVTIGEDVPYSITANSSAIYLLSGEKLTVEQLLYALLVESANDSAVALAEYISGSVKEFAILMNKKAASIGVTNSNFVTPNGLHDDNHYVTAYDMALIMREALKYPLLREMMTTVNYVIPATEKQITRYLWTKNKMLKLPLNKYYYDKVIATKTGYTTEASYTLVSAAKENNMELITVVLDGNSSSIYSDTINMFEYGFDNYSNGVLVNKGDFIDEVEFKGATSTLKLNSGETVPYVISNDITSPISSSIKLNEDLKLPIKKNENVGLITYTCAGEIIGETTIIAANNLESNISHYLHIGKIVLIGLGILLLTVYIVARVFVLSLNFRKRRKRYTKGSKNEYSGF